MKNDPLLSLLGLARRAGRLSIGFDAVKASVLRGRSELIITACDLSKKTEKELRYICRDTNIKVLSIDKDIFTLSGAIGTKAGCVSVTDKGFANAILKKAETTERATNDTEEELPI